MVSLSVLFASITRAQLLFVSSSRFKAGALGRVLFALSSLSTKAKAEFSSRACLVLLKTGGEKRIYLLLFADCREGAVAGAENRRVGKSEDFFSNLSQSVLPVLSGTSD